LHSILIIIGFAAACIITILPFKPRSARTSVLFSSARVIDIAAGLFAAEVEGVLEAAAADSEAYDRAMRISQYRTTVLPLLMSSDEAEKCD
jgi:hypothetical protein